jgi:hypothetical protein
MGPIRAPQRQRFVARFQSRRWTPWATVVATVDSLSIEYSSAWQQVHRVHVVLWVSAHAVRSRIVVGGSGDLWLRFPDRVRAWRHVHVHGVMLGYYGYRYVFPAVEWPGIREFFATTTYSYLLLNCFRCSCFRCSRWCHLIPWCLLCSHAAAVSVQTNQNNKIGSRELGRRVASTVRPRSANASHTSSYSWWNSYLVHLKCLCAFCWVGAS